MNLKTFIVDAFTDERFKGNPAGVCLLNNSISDELMFSIAKELGLSETAFVTKIANNNFSIRYFSPKMEIPLCGHATLAASRVLFTEDFNLDKIYFKTVQDLELEIIQSDNEILMQFPIYETVPAQVSTKLVAALGLNTYINCEFNKETNILILEINNSTVLRNLKPDFEALYKTNNTINGVLVTALSKDKSFDFESRYFWPWSGTNEDPVTGGTHTFLAKYWSTRIGKTKMKSFQCSERSGTMEVELLDANTLTIRSNAQIVFKGEIQL